ncbi:hypothetical protein [Methanoculleus sp. 10]|nr:hypothetical protein [Methanoculleus sp. 10]
MSYLMRIAIRPLAKSREAAKSGVRVLLTPCYVVARGCIARC